MTRPFETWKVLPHGKLTAVEDNLLTVVGDLHMPFGDFPRRMSVVRLQDGLKRIIVSHGSIIEHDPAFMLRDLASKLAAGSAQEARKDRRRRGTCRWR